MACQSGAVFPLTEGMTGAVVARRAPVWFDRYDDVPGGHVAPESRATIRGVIGVPLEWRGRIIGACIVFSRDGRRAFGPADAELLRLFARHAAIALANARMHEENARLTSAATENRRLRRLLQLRDELRGHLLPAQVIGEPVLFDIIFAGGEISDYRSTLRADSDALRRFNLALRGPSGWTSASLGPPPNPGLANAELQGAKAFDPGLLSSLWTNALPTEGEVGLYVRHADGTYTLGASGTSLRLVAASADLSRIVFFSSGHLLPGDALRTEGGSLYELDGSALRLLDVAPLHIEMRTKAERGYQLLGRAAVAGARATGQPHGRDDGGGCLAADRARLSRDDHAQ